MNTMPNDKELRKSYGRDIILHTDNPMSFERYKQIVELHYKYPSLSLAEKLAQLNELS